MELRNLQTFKTVVEVQGFSRAAEALGYAQSSITAQIQSLEEEIGSPLFNRLGKKITLTEAGKRLLPFALEILKMHASAVEATKVSEVPSGTIVIGAPESLAAYRLPAVIHEYRHLFPQVKIVLKPGLCWEMREKIKSGEIDIAFLLDQESTTPDIHKETLSIEPMLLIASPGHCLTHLQQVQPSDLHGETILSTEHGCSYRDLFEKYLQQQGTYINTDLEFWNIEAIKQCVMCGLGIAYLPYITIKSELEQKKIVALPWQDTIVPIATQLIYHKSKWLSPALQEFLRLLRQKAELWRDEHIYRRIGL